MNDKDLAKEFIVDITKEEYQADLARGLNDDEVLRPGRHTFRRGGFLERHNLSVEQQTMSSKVHLSLGLDRDVFEFIQERAAEPNGISYEKQINEMLRNVMREETEVYSVYNVDPDVDIDAGQQE